LLCQTFFFKCCNILPRGKFLSSARFGVQCAVYFCIGHAGCYVDVTQAMPNTKAVYSQVPVQILLHYSAVMTPKGREVITSAREAPFAYYTDAGNFKIKN